MERLDSCAVLGTNTGGLHITLAVPNFFFREKPLLEFLLNTAPHSGIDSYTFRNVCCEKDFEYYIEHLRNKSYFDYNIVYLCFHGGPGDFAFPADKKDKDKEPFSLIDFADQYEGIFKERPVNVHFGCCLTLNTNEDDILYFKRKNWGEYGYRLRKICAFR